MPSASSILPTSTDVLEIRVMMTENPAFDVLSNEVDRDETDLPKKYYIALVVFRVQTVSGNDSILLLLPCSLFASVLCYLAGGCAPEPPVLLRLDSQVRLATKMCARWSSGAGEKLRRFQRKRSIFLIRRTLSYIQLPTTMLDSTPRSGCQLSQHQEQVAVAPESEERKDKR